MINNKNLSRIEINPDGVAERAVIWLHGLGADGNDFAPIVPELNLSKEKKIKFIFPNAPSMPVTINNGYIMPAWFDIRSARISDDIDDEGIKNSVSSIQTIINNEVESGIDAGNIILAGFSQGALIALATALSYPEKLAGVMALSGLLPDSLQIIENASAANQGIPIFMAHGSQDMMLPLQHGESAYQALSDSGYQVEWHSYPMAHGVCPEEINDISAWINKIW